MLALIRTTLGGGGGTTRLLALGALLALLAAATLPIAPAAADGHPDDLELVLSLADDSDNVVPAGSEFTVEAALRFTSPHAQERRLSLADGGWLRLAGESLWEWEETGSTRLDVAQQLVMGGTPLTAVDADGDPLPSDAHISAKAADGRLIVARAFTNKLYLFDAWNKRQVGIIDAPAGAHANTFGGGTRTTGTSGEANLRGIRSVATWQEDEDTSWIFVGSRFDTVGAYTLVGRLYVYRVDWTAAGVQVGAPTVIHPSADEFRNRYTGPATDTRTEYGYSLNISRDGSTLAVTAPWANHMGAVYIYSRPDGPDRDWSDITHADAVKATPAVTPAWGTGVDATRPFNPTSGGRSDASADCDAWCSAVWAEVDVQWYNNWTTPHRIGLSADGRVIAVGRGKRYASTTPGGSFSSPKNFTGEIQVYVAPAGGWSAAPRADAGGRTLFATRTDASGFKPAQHYSAGPLRRVTATSAKLTIATWADAAGGYYFSAPVDVSSDGTAVVSTAHAPAYAYVFQLDPGEEWSGDMVYTARLQSVQYAGNHGGVEFSGDDRTIAIGNIDDRANTGAGEAYLYTRPANGTWVDAARTDPSARTILSSEGRTNNRWWGEVLYDLGGERLIISEYQRAAGALWLSDSGCTQRVAEDGLATWTCPLTLPTATVAVPEGTPDGALTLSGRLTLSVSGVADSAITLRDSLEVRIGKVQEVAEVKLDLALDSRQMPYPSALRQRGDSTRLRLQILNESGTASHAGSIAAAQLTSTAGNLAVVDATLEGVSCASVSCALNTANINASNADRLLVTLSHAGKAATAEVRATVFSTTGDTFETPPVRIALAGAAASIAVSAPTTGVTNVDAADLDADGLISDGAATRDELLLAVTAADSAGNDVALPSGARRTRLLGPDGQPVAAESVRVTWPHRGDPTKPFTRSGGENPPILNSKRQAQVKIDVNRPAANPLASGEYTLELWAGQTKATRTFSVSGGAAEISLSDPGAVRVDETFSVTATFNDASGVAVPNGTVVDWPEIVAAGGGGPRVVQTSKQTRTRDGQATASFQAVGAGSVAVTAGADCAEQLTSAGTTVIQCVVRGVRLVEIQPTEAAASSPAEALTTREPGGLASYLGAERVSAAELLAGLPEVGSVLLWLNGEWIRYGESGGEEIPGSINFRIKPGAILWLGE